MNLNFTETIDLVASPSQVAARPSSWPLNTEESRAFFASTLVFLVLAILAVIGRFYARKLKKIAWRLDDYLCLAGVMVYSVHFSLGVWVVWDGGLGHRQWFLTHSEHVVLYKQLLIVQIPYAIEMALIRISICVLFIRIFVPKWFRKTMNFSIALNILWFLFVFICAFTACYPFAANWNRYIPNSQCFPSQILYSIAAGWAVAMDLIIWVAPQAVVWKLQMRRIDKICVSAIFALGGLDIGISAVRVATLVTLHLGGDFGRNETQSQIWSTIEPGVAVIVACAPMLRVIVDTHMSIDIMKRITGQFSGRGSNGRSGSDSVAGNNGFAAPKRSGDYPNRRSTHSQRRRSEIHRANAEMTPSDRPTSDCIAKRVSLDSFLNSSSTRPSSQSGDGWWYSDKPQQQQPEQKQRRSWRQRLRWWDWSREVVRTRSRRLSQQFVRIRRDVTVTQDMIHPAQPERLVSAPLAPPASGGTSTLGGEYGESMSWQEMVMYDARGP